MPRFSTIPARRRAAAIVVALVALVVLSVPTAAHAGSYFAWSCHDANGALADVSNWSYSNTMADTDVGSSCTGGGGFVGINFRSRSGGNYPGGVGAAATYRSPAGTTIGAVTVDRYWVVPTGTDPDYVNTMSFLYNGVGAQLDGCIARRDGQGCSQSGTVFAPFSFDNAGNTTFQIIVGCNGNSDVSCAGNDSGTKGKYEISRAKVQLTDPTDPIASNVSGTALADGAISGSPTLAFAATDTGSGVWQAQIKLDDTVVWGRSVFNDNGGPCRNDGGAIGFPASVPCKLSTSATLPVDTTKVANGTHTLTATIWDAAGNPATVISRAVTVANPVVAPPPAPLIRGGGNGAPAGSANGAGGDRTTARFLKTQTPAHRVATYGHAVTVKGKLVDKAGKSIGGAHLDVLETVAKKGASPTYVATIDTDAKGHFAYKPATGPGRTISFAYVATVGDPAYLVQADVKLKVKAAVTLAVSTKRASTKTKIRFSGRVSSGVLPSGGARVVIETRGKHSWLIVADLNTNAAGKFSWSHKFSVRGPYRFRARTTHASDLPIASGTSALRPVRIR
jgi:hypothetical protein